MFFLTLCASIALGSFAETRSVSDDYESLIGEDSLEAWDIVGDAEVAKVSEGVLSLGGQFPNAWLRSKQSYENFHLQFEFKPRQWCEAGLCIHSPFGGELMTLGKSIRLAHRQGGQPFMWSGTITGAVPSIEKDAVHKIERKKDQETVFPWNLVDVEMRFPLLRVHINDVLVQEVNVESHDALSHRLPFGYLALQPIGSSLELKNMKIKRLPGTDHGFRSLFNGKDFEGWIQEDAAEWSVEDGVIKSTGHGYLLTKEAFGNLEFHGLMRASDRANGGVFFRWASLKPRVRGFEVQIFNEPLAANPTGSLYSKHRARSLECEDNEWFAMQVRVVGNHARCWINGIEVSEGALSLKESGFIALQMHRNNATIEFRDLWVKSLPSQENEEAGSGQ